MSRTLAIVAGIGLVTLAAANVAAMLEACRPSRKARTRIRLIAFQKIKEIPLPQRHHSQRTYEVTRF